MASKRQTRTPKAPSTINTKDLAKAVADEFLARQPSLDADRHVDHHRWIETQIEAAERRKRWIDKLSNSVVGGVILMIISGLAWLGWTAINLVRSE